MGAKAEPQPPEALPPLNPEGEASLQDEAFRNECLSQMKASSGDLGFKLGPPLLTRSERWGIILRADFKTPSSIDAHRINRVVCWKADGRLNIAYTIEQDIAPLEVNSPEGR